MEIRIDLYYNKIDIHGGYDMKITDILDNWRQRGYIPHLCENGEQAVHTALQLIPAGSTIGIGGSMTVKQIGLEQQLVAHGCTVHGRVFGSTDPVPPTQWYISSANAITERGDIVNIDGTANRVSALIYGIPNILYVVGVNKICPDLDAAMDRARNIAAPLNAKRLNRNVPCAQSGVCTYCDAADCICNTTVIAHHPTRVQKAVHILLIEEELGL